MSHPSNVRVIQHDVESPDEFCLGDDPCICEQLHAARQQSIRLCVENLAAVPVILENRTEYRWYIDRDRAITAVQRVAGYR